MPRKLTAYDRERDSVWLDLVESGESTTAEIATMAGLTQRQVQSRIKSAKEKGQRDPSDETGELPWVELVYGAFPPTPHYDYKADRLVKPAGLFRINNGRGRLRVEHAGNDRTTAEARAAEDDKKPPAKFRPRQRVKKPKPARVGENKPDSRPEGDVG